MWCSQTIKKSLPQSADWTLDFIWMWASQEEWPQIPLVLSSFCPSFPPFSLLPSVSKLKQKYNTIFTSSFVIGKLVVKFTTFLTLELERWLCNSKHWLLFQRTLAQSLTLTWRQLMTIWSLAERMQAIAIIIILGNRFFRRLNNKNIYKLTFNSDWYIESYKTHGGY